MAQTRLQPLRFVTFCTERLSCDNSMVGFYVAECLMECAEDFVVKQHQIKLKKSSFLWNKKISYSVVQEIVKNSLSCMRINLPDNMINQDVLDLTKMPNLKAAI